MTNPSTRRPDPLARMGSLPLAAALILSTLAAACGGGGTPSSGTEPFAKYVATTGSDEADGSAEHPYLTIAKAIAAVKSSLAEGTTGEVRVAAGTYQIVEPITLVEGVSLKGGYSTSSWSDRGYRTKEEREDTRYKTLIVASASGAASTAPTVLGSGNSLTRATVVEGFTIAGGRRAESPVGGFRGLVVSIKDDAGVSLRNNTIRDTASGGGEIDPQMVGGWALVLIEVVSDGTAVVAHNTLEIGRWYAEPVTAAVYGIRVSFGAHIVEGNEIRGGEILWAGSGYSYGLKASYGEHHISNNTIHLGQVSATREQAVAEGIGLSTTNAIVDGNLILGGLASGPSSGVSCHGIAYSSFPGYLDESAIYFNTIVMGELDTPNPASNRRGGIVVWEGARARIANNIVHSPRGLGTGSCIRSRDSTVAVRNNDLFGCDVVLSSGDTEVRSVEELNALTTLEVGGNLGVDPLFVNMLMDDYHLSTRSPANLAVRGGALDLGIPADKDGKPRTTSKPSGAGLSGISLGAYESD